MFSRLIIPRCLISRFGRDADRLYQIINFYLTIIIIYLIIMSLTYYTIDSCTNIMHEKLNRDYCEYFNYFFYIFEVIIIMSVIINIIVSIYLYHFNKYKKYGNTATNTDYIYIMITIYKESKEEILQTLTSIKNTNYKNLLVVLVLDGIDNQENVKEILQYTNMQSITYIDNIIHYTDGLYEDDIKYLLLVKERNRGKKDSHCIFYKMLNILNDKDNHHELSILSNHLTLIINYSLYKYILILDCDTTIDKNSILVMTDVLNKNNNYLAICGNTQVNNKNQNLITMAQTFEYFISHLLLKLFEHALGNILVLSGCFSMIRLYNDNGDLFINKEILTEYYYSTPTNIIEDNLHKIGEDRFLTNILIKTYQDYKIKFIMKISCYTNVPDNVGALIRQRVRWTNSLVACHIYLLKQKYNSMWKTVKMYYIVLLELFIAVILPLLIIIGLMNSIFSLTIQGFSLTPLIITVNVIILNMYVILLSTKFIMLLYYIPFLLLSPFFMVWIPLYSLLSFKNVRWDVNHRSNQDYLKMTDTNV